MTTKLWHSWHTKMTLQVQEKATINQKWCMVGKCLIKSMPSLQCGSSPTGRSRTSVTPQIAEAAAWSRGWQMPGGVSISNVCPQHRFAVGFFVLSVLCAECRSLWQKAGYVSGQQRVAGTQTLHCSHTTLSSLQRVGNSEEKNFCHLDWHRIVADHVKDTLSALSYGSVMISLQSTFKFWAL